MRLSIWKSESVPIIAHPDILMILKYARNVMLPVLHAPKPLPAPVVKSVFCLMAVFVSNSVQCSSLLIVELINVNLAFLIVNSVTIMKNARVV